jgi:hypothetical protein
MGEKSEVSTQNEENKDSEEANSTWDEDGPWSLLGSLIQAVPLNLM